MKWDLIYSGHRPTKRPTRSTNAFASDKSLNMHYATLSRRLLQQACRVCIDLADARVARVGGGTWTIGLADVADLLSIKTLRSVKPFVSPAVAASLTRYLDDLDASKTRAT